MPFECRVRLDKHIIAAVRRAPRHIACHLPRILVNDVFSTIGDEELLMFVDSGTRDRAGPGALLHASHDIPMTWVGRGHKRPHVRFYGPAPIDHVDGDPSIHHWIRGRLFHLGAELEQEPEIEFPVDGQHERICDVLWRKSRIAWEVDLSPQAQLDQRRRMELCKANGLRMISVVDEDDKNLTNDRFPRIRVLKLKQGAKDPAVAPWGFARSYVDNFFEVSATDSGPRWTMVHSVEFQRFCRDLMSGDELRYQRFGQHFRWVRTDDITTYERLRREAEERAQREAAQRAQDEDSRRAQRVQAQIEQHRLTAEREAAEVHAFLTAFRQRLVELQPDDADSRGSFLESTRTLPRDLDERGAIKAAVVELRRALGGYDQSWWRRLLRETGPSDRAKAHAILVVAARIQALGAAHRGRSRDDDRMGSRLAPRERRPGS